MTNLDYSSEEVMKLLNNPDYDDAQKKDLFEKYKNNLKQLRRKEIINKVSEVAKNIPTFSETDYVDFMKNYENDDLSKPFNVICSEIKNLENRKKEEYQQFIESQKQKEVVEEVVPEISEEDAIVPDIRSRVEKYSEPEIEKTNLKIDVDNSVLNEEPEMLAKPLFSDDGDAKDVMPSTIAEPLGEKGNASAIIVSIIAIIIGALIMYTLIKIN